MRGTERAPAALERLAADGLVHAVGPRYRTTRRWQGFMARAALRLVRGDEPSSDLRVPITHALLDVYGPAICEDELIALIEAMLPIEAGELGAAG